MQISDYIFLIFGIVLLLAGLASVVTRKIYMGGARLERYTEESLKKYAIPCGLGNMCSGAALVLYHIFKGDQYQIGGSPITIGLVLLFVFGIACIVITIASRKILVKK